MNSSTSLRLAAAARNTAVGRLHSLDPNEFGQRVMSYNGIPILIAKENNVGNDILPFTEPDPGGGAAASTSIYAVSFGDGGVVGIQNQDISVRDLGELEAKPVFRTRVEWYPSIAVLNGRSMARLRGIKDVAITA